MLRLEEQGGRSALDLPPRADGATGEEDDDEEEAVLPAVLLAEREPNRENWGVKRGFRQSQKKKKSVSQIHALRSEIICTISSD